MAWTEQENEVAIAAYFALLVRVFNGERVVKSQVYRDVSRELGERRNVKSVERKFCNYSYVLHRMGHPYVPGLRPLPNIQHLVMPTLVEEYIADHDPFAKIPYPEEGPDPEQYLDRGWAEVYDKQPPERRFDGEPVAFDPVRVSKVDFAARDARNRRLGEAGERFVLGIQVQWLREEGQDRLARRVEHVALRNDAAGYDVRSYYPDGRERLIEVKTTPYPETTPFYLTANELAVSRRHTDAYEIHRVYNWNRGPRVFVLPAPLKEHMELEPVQYRARL